MADREQTDRELVEQHLLELSVRNISKHNTTPQELIEYIDIMIAPRMRNLRLAATIAQAKTRGVFFEEVRA